MNDKGTCRDCALKENCAEYKENKSQCEDYESYNEPLTNEEWLRSATTEQLIELLEKITDPHVGYLVGYWEKWLKQPHTDKEL